MVTNRSFVYFPVMLHTSVTIPSVAFIIFLSIIFLSQRVLPTDNLDVIDKS